MVTKPTGRPCGRPRKPIATITERRKRGRPAGSVPFLQDPDRYRIAFALAFQTDFHSVREGTKWLAALECGNPIIPPNSIAAKCPPGYQTIAFGPVRELPDGKIYNTMPRRGVAASIDGRARTLRKKIKVACESSERDPAVQKWLAHMSTAYLLGINIWRSADPRYVEIIRLSILQFADAVGEKSFALKHMMPPG